MTFDRTQTLEQLENSDWGDPDPDIDSAWMMTIRHLRRKPLNRFTAEDLRILIGHGVGFPFLIPLAIERLTEDPLTKGYLHRGDLLRQVLRVSPGFWKEHKELYMEVETIIGDLEIIRDTIENQLLPAAEAFRGGRLD